MLYDPKWEQQTKADPLTLPSLIAWLEKQDPTQGYEFSDCSGGCLIGLYMAAHDMPWNTSDAGTRYTDVCRKMFGTLPDSIIPKQSVASEFPRTFGAALVRARKLRGTF